MTWYEILGICLAIGAVVQVLNSILAELGRTNRLISELAEVVRDNQVNTNIAADCLSDLRRKDSYADRVKLFEKLDSVINELDSINHNTNNR